jgi:glycosyltransferase involved in cell wall biosynthesis
LGKPFVVTVHDLVRICFPFTTETVREKLSLKLDAFGLKKAQQIIAVSECTKLDLIRYLKIPESRITTIYNGVDHTVFKPVCGGRFDFPYLLYVGTERPRKNLGTLLRAFALLKKDTSAFGDFKLVKVGSAGRTDKFRHETLRELRYLGLEGEVIFVDGVSNEGLADYYSSAAALIMPSFYEGFGLPLIEAMACGCPVIASNSSSLPEVAGDAALFVDPHDQHGLAEAIRRVTANRALREEMIEKGFRRAQQFSWEKTAQETLQVYHRIGVGLAIEKRKIKGARYEYRTD